MQPKDRIEMPSARDVACKGFQQTALPASRCLLRLLHEGCLQLFPGPLPGSLAGPPALNRWCLVLLPTATATTGRERLQQHQQRRASLNTLDLDCAKIASSMQSACTAGKITHLPNSLYTTSWTKANGASSGAHHSRHRASLRMPAV